ncbi:hypothetical protein [Synechococcus sp. BA-132 BA5]|uniref:hypothetical protein n=1 Tax=Synechococcus sp. BA-132 BA5 TaxID=3110252 RepID=UPI002B20BF21|nr:hypothetical protein [Synechococcus sp. BA-132 BA5]MEA5416292.1 hypothetical protein [Synechococcus sp. BA-132 BA5]
MELLLLLVLVAFVVLLTYLLAKRRKNTINAGSFERVYQLLTDEEAQNGALPSLTQYLKNNADHRNVGEDYGLDPRDPIRVNGPLGELVYISRLTSERGTGFIGHRLGSIKGLDVFEVVSTDFKDWLILWFDMYWSTKDPHAPAGLRLNRPDELWPDGGHPALSATNRFVAKFPDEYWPEILISTMEHIGFPSVKPFLKSLNGRQAERPSGHTRLLQDVVVMSRAQGIGDDS